MDTRNLRMPMLIPQSADPLASDPVTRLLQCRRIAIVGNQGSGKTTLAKNLSALLGLPFVNIVWPGDISEAEQRGIIDRVLKQQTWIIDGDFGLLPHAEGIIFFDFPRLLCMGRAAKRSIRNLPNWQFRSAGVWSRLLRRTGNLLRLLTVVYRYPSQQRQQIVTELHTIARTIPVITVTSPQEVAALWRALEDAHRARPADVD